ncbi:TPA: hypothetical protein ACOENR_003304 [Stenotrophomonas maltophilia]
MFFWLKDERDVLGGEVLYDEYAACIENLGEAGYRKEHLVFGDRTIIARAMSLDISRKAKTYYASVLAKYATLGGLHREVRRVFVSTGCYAPAVENGVWTVPLSAFSDVSAVASCIMVVEHMYDYTVILGLVDIYLAQAGLASLVGINLFPAAGGGGGTHLSLSMYQRDARKLGICVLDSDRSHVHDALGNTAGTCKRIFAESWRWRMHIVCGRELENVIPPGVLRAVGIDSPYVDDSNYSDERWPIMGYVDLKAGDYICRFKNIDRGNKSFLETNDVIDRHFGAVSACDDGPCRREACLLCRSADSMLSDLAGRIQGSEFRKMRKLPQRVKALEKLIDDVVAAGAVARWNFT